MHYAQRNGGLLMDEECTFFADSNFFVIKLEIYSKLKRSELNALQSVIDEFHNMFMPKDSTLQAIISRVDRESVVALVGKDKTNQYFNGITTMAIKSKNCSAEYMHTIMETVKIFFDALDVNYKIHDLEYYGELDD
jgi:hypothetical protein